MFIYERDTINRLRILLYYCNKLKKFVIKKFCN